MQLALFQKEPVGCFMHDAIAYQLVPYGPCKTLELYTKVPFTVVFLCRLTFY